MKKYQTQIIILSLLSVAGLTYFIYSKVKIYNLNNRVTSLEDIQQQLDNLPVDDTPIEDTPVNPDILPSEDFGANSPISTESDDDYYGSYE